MRIVTTVFLLGLLALGLQSCDWLIPLLRSHPQAPHLPDQNIILFRPQLTATGSQPMPIAMQHAMVQAANESLKNAGKDTLRISRWCPCDSSLVLLEGHQLDDLLINGREMASSTRPSGGVSGNPPFADITYNPTANELKWPELVGEGSLNYILSLPFYHQPKDAIVKVPLRPFILPTDSTTKPFIIAITDTGFQPGLYPAANGQFWVNPGESTTSDRDQNGLVGDMTGWDFVTNTNLPYDSNGHGTLVTSLIHEQLRTNEWASKNVRFMYLKTYSLNGKGTLFNNLCALSYARQKGAQLINASWGFYSPKESLLLGYFIKELSATNRVLVVAAGNANGDLERSPFGLVPSSYYRNLETNPFWPARYSGAYQHVITATTIHPTTKALASKHTSDDFLAYSVCADQNYSDPFVNVGVYNNRNRPNPYCSVLNITAPNQGAMASGSSFAAPVVTGRLAARLGETWTTGKRDVLFARLENQSATIPAGTPQLPTLRSHPTLTSQINAGRYIKRVEP
ncbi:S8 family serine peptidase [Larkinella bovis]|uniref:S8 family serine peptidase n=1 Tax=Larkinella bovis TaxID=683041 RepID=A0ABW0I4W4_9BACT